MNENHFLIYFMTNKWQNICFMKIMYILCAIRNGKRKCLQEKEKKYKILDDALPFSQRLSLWTTANDVEFSLLIKMSEWKFFGFRKAWTAWYRKYDFIIYFIHWEKNVFLWRKRKTAKNYIWSLRFRSGRFLFIIVGKERKLFMILQTRNVCLQLFIEF